MSELIIRILMGNKLKPQLPADEVDDEGTHLRLERTNYILWVNTFANIISAVALILIALLKK